LCTFSNFTYSPKFGKSIVCKAMKNAEIKSAFVGDINYLRYIKGTCHFSPLILDEIVVESQGGMGVQRNHYLYFHIQALMERLVEAGIMQMWYAYHKWEYYRPWVIEELKIPQVLTIQGLSFGFIIWLCACGVSTIVFVLEIIIGWITRRNRRGDNLVKVKLIKVQPI
jgi:hypothetical protein